MANKVAKRSVALLAGLTLTASLTAGVVSQDNRGIATVSTPVVLSATTVLAMGGLGYEDVDEGLIRSVLGGQFASTTDYTVVGVPWPGQMAPWNGDLTLGESVSVGLQNMDAAIRAQLLSDPNGKIIVVGASGTTFVVNEEMRLLASSGNAPDPSQISFIVLGDANRGAFAAAQGQTLPIFDYNVPVIPVTPYNITVVKGEYDGIGDWPDRWWNLLAVANAMAGTGLLQQLIPEDIVNEYHLEDWGSVHKESMFVDLSTVPAQNVTTTRNADGGYTTTYVVPSPDLPLLRPLAGLGVPQGTIDALEAVLRPMIDSAYVRNDRPLARTANSVRSGKAAADAVSSAGSSAAQSAAGSASTRSLVARPAEATSTTASQHGSSTPKKSAKSDRRSATKRAAD